MYISVCVYIVFIQCFNIVLLFSNLNQIIFPQKTLAFCTEKIAQFRIFWPCLFLNCNGNLCFQTFACDIPFYIASMFTKRRLLGGVFLREPSLPNSLVHVKLVSILAVELSQFLETCFTESSITVFIMMVVLFIQLHEMFTVKYYNILRSCGFVLCFRLCSNLLNTYTVVHKPLSKCGLIFELT